MKGGKSETFSYVKIDENGLDEFSILFNVEDKGIYTINVEIEYTYKGKIFNVKSKEWKFIIDSWANIVDHS